MVCDTAGCASHSLRSVPEVAYPGAQGTPSPVAYLKPQLFQERLDKFSRGRVYEEIGGVLLASA